MMTKKIYPYKDSLGSSVGTRSTSTGSNEGQYNAVCELSMLTDTKNKKILKIVNSLLAICTADLSNNIYFTSFITESFTRVHLSVCSTC